MEKKLEALMAALEDLGWSVAIDADGDGMIIGTAEYIETMMNMLQAASTEVGQDDSGTVYH